MNEINQFFVAGDKFMPEINLRQPGFMYSTGGPCSKNKECKNLKKQETHNIFLRTNWAKVAFRITWFMKILKVYLEEQLLVIN